MEQNRQMEDQILILTQQLDWLKRQLFGLIKQRMLEDGHVIADEIFIRYLDKLIPGGSSIGYSSAAPMPGYALQSYTLCSSAPSITGSVRKPICKPSVSSDEKSKMLASRYPKILKILRCVAFSVPWLRSEFSVQAAILRWPRITQKQLDG